MDARLRARRRAVTTARRRRRRRLWLVAAALVALAIAAVAIGRSPLLEVDAIAVQGAGGERAQQVRQQVVSVLGTPLALVDTQARASAAASLPWVGDAAVSRRLPGTVQVEVEPRQPIAVVRAGGGQWRVDDLVPVHGGDAVVPAPGRTLRDATLRQAVRTVAALPPELAQRVAAVDASRPRALALRLSSGPTALLGSAERLEAKLDALALVLADLEQRSDDGLGGIAEIDVRTPENPTVRRATASDDDPG